ncbi:bifunctional nuclease family protein [Microbacterium sp. W1N]|uniref:bifunctional nuclease family protein n=1 Tax=Microbacterium festucae TaxID=2977531 RepID=UPI0021BF021A|nr:bifunctional nuclease family protein [Microbacterium festucae]MCT9820942.1 bifunctional nuclease family protein [Microbacterium festucae]
MVQVIVGGIALDAAGEHVILLRPVGQLPGAGKVLPIWIGAQEATSILIAVEGAVAPRPLAHDLMRTMLTTVGAVVERVEVTRIDEGTFYAEVTLRHGGGVHRVDARPSDAIALASRTAAPIFVADDVLDTAGIVDVIGDDDETPEEVERSVEEFTRFLDDVDPEDFKG